MPIISRYPSKKNFQYRFFQKIYFRTGPCKGPEHKDGLSKDYFTKSEENGPQMTIRNVNASSMVNRSTHAKCAMMSPTKSPDHCTSRQRVMFKSWLGLERTKPMEILPDQL